MTDSAEMAVSSYERAFSLLGTSEATYEEGAATFGNTPLLRGAINWWPAAAAITAALLAMRFVLYRTIFGSLAERYVPRGPKGMDPALEEVQRSLLKAKFKKYCWHAIAYLGMFIEGARLMYKFEWSVINQGHLGHLTWGLPHVSKDRAADPELMEELLLFACFQVSWYAHGLIENVLYDRSRSDFLMMFTHHVLTLGLIHLAFNIGGMHRVGLHVMTTLDIADVVMYLAKGYHLASSDLTGTSYTGYELCQFFAMGAVSNTWMVSRVICFGSEVAALFSQAGCFLLSFETMVFFYEISYLSLTPGMWWCGNILLWALTGMLGLQIIWCYYITKMWVNMFSVPGHVVDTCSGDFSKLEKLAKDIPKGKIA